MCGRFEVLTYDEVARVVAAVEARRSAAGVLEEVDEWGHARAHARPGARIALLAPGGVSAPDAVGGLAVGGSESGFALEVAEAVWGFTAPWNNKLVFNTRIESALEGSGMWRGAARQGRCIIPVASFFETHATETVKSPRTGRPIKRAYRFSDPRRTPLLLAGVQADGCCSIVTCEPNRWVAPVHPRMPLALRFEEVEEWLGDDWSMLADRSDFALTVEPEFADSPNPESDQLTLF